MPCTSGELVNALTNIVHARNAQAMALGLTTPRNAKKHSANTLDGEGGDRGGGGGGRGGGGGGRGGCGGGRGGGGGARGGFGRGGGNPQENANAEKTRFWCGRTGHIKVDCHAKKHLDGTALVVAASPQAPASATAAAAAEKPDPDKVVATLTAKIKEKAHHIDETFLEEFNTMVKTAIAGEFDRCATVSSTSTTSTAVAASAQPAAADGGKVKKKP